MAPTIETPRLLLRPWRETDDDAWVAMTADPRVTEFLGWQWDRPRALALAERFATGLREKGYGWWVVEVKDAVHSTPAFEGGWHFAAAHWGKATRRKAGRPRYALPSTNSVSLKSSR
jgi:RimJ/RimL family protein N-acetyltransferase